MVQHDAGQVGGRAVQVIVAQVADLRRASGRPREKRVVLLGRVEAELQLAEILDRPDVALDRPRPCSICSWLA